MILLEVEPKNAGVNPNHCQADSKNVECEERSRLVPFLLDQEHPRVSESHDQLAGETEG